MNDFESVIEEEVDSKISELSRFSEGLKHETFQVEYGDEVVVFQFALSDGRELELLYKNEFWYRFFSDLGLPIPSVRSDGVCNSGDMWYIVTDCLDGKNAEQDVKPERVRNAGRYLAMLHDARDVEGSKFLQVDESGVSLVDMGYDSWIRGMFSDSVKQFERSGLSDLSVKLEDVWHEFDTSIPSGFDSVVCHNDYSPDNVLFNGDEITGILDFDIAYVGDRYRDVVDAANGFWMHDPTADWDPRNTFYEGYEKEHDLGDEFWESERFYRFETQVVTVSSLADSGLLTEYEKNFYSETILDALERFRNS